MTSEDFVQQLNPSQFGSLTVHCHTRWCPERMTMSITTEDEMRAALDRAGWRPSMDFELRFTDGPAKPLFCPVCCGDPS